MNILTLAAYERARRALRGECEPNSRAGKMRTNISNEPSANIVKMREVCSRPRRLRQNKKDRQKRSFWSKRRDSILARTARSVFHGRGHPPEVRSVPFPLRVPCLKSKKGYTARVYPLYLVEAAGLEPTVSSTRIEIYSFF